MVINVLFQMIVVVVFLQLKWTKAARTVALFAKEAIRAKGKLITRHKLLVASHTAKAFQVENLVLGSHDKITGTEGASALLALGAKQPATGSGGGIREKG